MFLCLPRSVGRLCNVGELSRLNLIKRQSNATWALIAQLVFPVVVSCYVIRHILIEILTANEFGRIVLFN